MTLRIFCTLPLLAILACSSDAAAESPPADIVPLAAVPDGSVSDEGAPTAMATEGGVTLSVRLTNFRSADGQVLVALFRGGEGFPMKPGNAYRTAVAKIAGSGASLEFADLPPGEYAFSVIHDENGNNELDTNFLGIPKEGIGTSNNAKGRMGPPKYRDAKFSVAAEPVSQRVKMVYM